MATYDGKYGPQACHDCGAQATEYLGRRARTESGRTHMFTCKGCGDARLGRPEKPAQSNTTPFEARTANFTHGHKEPEYRQGSLFEE
jgi:hypothetical protein